METKFNDDNFGTLSKLAQRGMLEVERVRRDENTGSQYRQLEPQLPDATVAIGGGKDTYTSGTDMLEAGEPGLPLDLKTGDSSIEGDGVVLISR